MTLTGQAIVALRELAAQMDGLGQAWVVGDPMLVSLPA